MLSIDRNGAKICKENPRVFTERKIRGKVFHEIYYHAVTPAHAEVGGLV
jgi:hypothetical protein